MKRLKLHWSARPLSWILSAAIVWPAIFFIMVGGISSRAQVLTPGGPPLWAVLDFENRSGYGGPEIGRTASDAFVVELGKSNRYEVLSRQETQQGLADIGQTPPLDVIGLQKLGRTVSARAVVTGEVASVTFSNNPRQATASVVIRVTDTVTGELINGALAQGVSNPQAVNTGDDDALVNQAIDNAAFAAVRKISQFNLPRATVLNNIDQDTVILNKGTRDGLYDGLDMVVTRAGSEVGRIRISEASSDQSNAVVTVRGLGIQPQDIATAIYQLPAYRVTPDRVLHANSSDVSSDGAGATTKRSAFGGITGIIVALLAAALLLNIINRGKASGSLGGAEVGKPLAVSNRVSSSAAAGTPNTNSFGPGVEPGAVQYSVVLATGLQVQSPPQPADWTPIVIDITADSGNIPIIDIIEYHVYRSDFPAVLSNAPSFVTDNTTTTGTTNANNFTGFGLIPLIAASEKTLLTYDDGADHSVTASKPVLTVGTTTTTTTTTGGTGSTANGIETVSSNGAPVPGTGIQHVGDRFQYFIEALYLQPGTLGGSTQNPGQPGNSGTTTNNNTTGTTGTNNTGTNNTTGQGFASTYQLTGLSNTNFVTYCEPVLFNGASAANGPLGSFAASTGPTNVTISVPSTRSADDYVLEIANNLAFNNKVTYTPDSTGPYSADITAPRRGNDVTWFLRSGDKNPPLSTTFAGATQIFARIGCRDSRNGTSNSTNAYVYSDPVQVPASLVPAAGGSTITPPAAPTARKR